MERYIKMKRFKKKKKSNNKEPKQAKASIDYIDGEKLICPYCKTNTSLIIRSYETIYYEIDSLIKDGEYGIYADWGNQIDSGDSSESTIICENCFSELSEDEIFKATVDQLI